MAENKVYCVEITAYDPSVPGVITLRYATEGGIYGGNYYHPRLVQPGNFTINLFQAGKTSGQSQVGYGEIVLINSDGGLDSLRNYGFDGRSILFKTFTISLGLVLVTGCSMGQPTYNYKEIAITIRDNQSLLDVPIQPTKYAGTNTLPAGLEGVDDIKGKPKPLTFGTVYNISPVQVNTSKLIYQVHTGTVTIPNVYDMGIALVQGATYASQAAMEATAPDPGTYRVWQAGGCFRLGSTPAGQLTCDAIEGATAADRTAAQIADRILLRVLSSGSISSADITSLDSVNSAEVGIYVKDESTVLVALDQVLGSVGAYYGFDISAVLRMKQLVTPAGTPDLTLTNGAYFEMDRVASNDTTSGISPYKVNLQYQKNYTVQTSGLAGQIGNINQSGAASWIQRVLSASSTWGAVAFGNGIFVAITNSGTVGATSLDGKTWTACAIPTGEHYTIAFGNGVFVIVLYGSNAAYTSPDGVNWTAQTLSASDTWFSVCFGNGTFVAIARNSNNASISTNSGVTWATKTLPGSLELWQAVTWGKDKFVAIVSGSNITATSPTGVTWTQHAMPSIDFWYKIAYGNGAFVSITGTTVAASSVDGITWIARVMPENIFWGDVAFGAGLFISVSDNSTSDNSTNIAAVSTDGITWIRQTLPAYASWRSVIYGNGRFVSLAYYSSIAASLDVAVPSDRAIWLSQEYRTKTDSDASIQTLHLLAPEMNVTTLLVDGTAAQAECTRLLTLYKAQRDMYRIKISANKLSFLAPGSLIKLYSTRYGLTAGKLFTVIGVDLDWQNNYTILTVWG